MSLLSFFTSITVNIPCSLSGFYKVNQIRQYAISTYCTLTTTALAEVFQRWKLLHRKVLLNVGTDEYGMRIYKVAGTRISYKGNSMTKFLTHLRYPPGHVLHRRRHTRIPANCGNYNLTSSPRRLLPRFPYSVPNRPVRPSSGEDGTDYGS